jgi:hypothetical protein
MPFVVCPSCKSRLEGLEAPIGRSVVHVCPSCESQVVVTEVGGEVVAVPAQVDLPTRHTTPREGLVAELGGDQVGGSPVHVSTSFEQYVFVEEADRLRVLWSAGEHAVKVGCSAVPLLVGVGALVALAKTRDPAQVMEWQIAAAAVAVLGCWLLWWVLARGRTFWVLDRQSGQLVHRGKPLRPLSSITHVAIYGIDPSQPFYVVGFAPKQDSFAASIGARGFRKDILGFQTQEKAQAAASYLAAFLKVEVVSELLE